MKTGRTKFSLGLDFSGDRVERRKNGRFNRAGEEKIERWIEKKEGQRSPCLGGPWAC